MTTWVAAQLVGTIFLLLVLFQIKHFVADYPLQGKYMLGKFNPDWSFLLPLFAHAGVHGCFTLAICLVFAPQLWWLSLIDIAVHFLMDRAKAGPKYLGRFKAMSAEEMHTVKHIMNVDADLKADPDKYDSRYFDMFNGYKQSALNKVRSNTFFWWALGLDQMVHHLTHYIFIAFIIGAL